MTEKGTVTRSRLLIQKADRADNGVYSCDPTTAAAATIHVHILNGSCLYTKSHESQSVLSTYVHLANNLQVLYKITQQFLNPQNYFIIKS